MKVLKALSALVFIILPIPDYYCNGAVEIQVGRNSLDDLLDAIALVESNNNPDAIGDNGKAVGMYQIHKIYVDDVNRILGKREFSYTDRKDPLLSRIMVKIYLQHYGRDKTLEAIARIHNGGPRGDKKKSTEKYWLKVKAMLAKVEK